MSNVTIISGFPGVGKSTVAEKFGWTDIDSSNYGDKSDPQRWETFQVPYVDDIIKKRDELENTPGSVILVSSHEQVRQEMGRREVAYINCFPEGSFIDEYMRRFDTRGDSAEFKALIQVKHVSWLSSMYNDIGCSGRLRLHRGQPYLGLTTWAILNAPASAIRTPRNSLPGIEHLNKFFSAPNGSAWHVIGIDSRNNDLWMCSIEGKRSVKVVSSSVVGRTYHRIEDLGDYFIRREAKGWA